MVITKVFNRDLLQGVFSVSNTRLKYLALVTVTE